MFAGTRLAGNENLDDRPPDGRIHFRGRTLFDCIRLPTVLGHTARGAALMAKQRSTQTTSSTQATSSAPSTDTSRYQTVSGAQIRIDTPLKPRRFLQLSGTISIKELKRRLWHMIPGLIPIASYIYPHKDPLSPTFQAIAAGVMLTITASLLWRFKTIRRAGEVNELGAVFGYAGATLLTLLLFPWHAELGMLVLCVLAFGDGMATTLGMLLRGPRLPWNTDKTWVGLAAFVGFGGYLASLAYWAESQPQASWTTAMLCGFSAAVIAAVAESLPSRINDNIRVGVASAVTAVTAHAVIVGL